MRIVCSASPESRTKKQEVPVIVGKTDAGKLRFASLSADLSSLLLRSTADDIEHRIEQGLERIGDTLDLDRVAFRWFTSRAVLEIALEWQRAGGPQLPAVEELTKFPWGGPRLLLGETCRFSRFEDIPREAKEEREWFRAAKFKSWMAIPTLVGDKHLGVCIFATWRTTRVWSDALTEDLRSLSETIASALIRARAEKALQERLWFQRLSAEVSTLLLDSPTPDIDGQLERALRRIGEAVDADRVIVGLSDNKPTVGRLTHGWRRPGVSPLPDTLEMSLLPWTEERMSRGERVRFSRLEDLPPEAQKDREAFGKLPIKALLIVPIATRGQNLGYCALVMDHEGRKWSDQLATDLKRVTETIANWLLYARKTLELRAREQELARAQAIAHVGSLVYEISTDRMTLSEESMRLVGSTRRQMSAQEYLALMVPEDRAPTWAVVRKVLEAGGEFKIEYRVERPDGSIRHIRDHAVIDCDAEGRPVIGMATLLDITDQVEAEEALRRREADLSRSQKMAKVGSWTFDPATGLDHWSAELCALYGVEPSEAGHERFKELIHPEDRARVVGELEAAMASDALDFELEFRILRPDGGIRFVRDRAQIERNPDRSVRSVFGTVLDVTADKELNELLAGALTELSRLKERLQAENRYLQEEIRSTHGFDEIVGESEGLKHCLRLVEQVAPTDSIALIQGETGTGKELIARAIHRLSRREKRPLVKVNCAALPATLIESELFGHERGAFTGADKRREGRFELADGGTLFLDEIGDMPLELQGKLLRVLQEGELERVGGTQTLRIDVRVIAATNRDLADAVKKETFRADLFYRINVFPITVPPLRERMGDIPLLVEHFAHKHARRVGRRIESISKRMLERLRGHDWPGNLRELENTVERALISATGPVLDLPLPFENRLVRPESSHRPAASTTNLSLRDLERRHIESVLERAGWTIEGKKGAASMLGMAPSSLRSKMKKLRIVRDSPRTPDP